jgi:hypothetical protein
MSISRTCAVLATAVAATLTSAAAASAFVIGPGGKPGVAVDAAGTAYIAWDGPEANNSTLRFCRLARGATACDVGPATLPAPATTTAGGRPFVVVSGARVVVVQYRYPTSGTVAPGVYRFTSANGGVTFDPPEVVGSVAFDQAAVGPGDTLTGVPVDGAMFVQNVALSGPAPLNLDGSSAVPKAELSTTHLNYAAVGLIDAATPLAVFTNGTDAQVRRYNGSGSLNDIASWSAPAAIGVASYPRLAGGPNGLFLLAGDAGGNLVARKWDGAGFGPAATIGPGSSPYKHLFQDAAGRLHAVFQRDSADPLQIVHAVSDDGVTWRSGTLVKQSIATDGGIADLRVATAADHIGVTVWHAGVAAGGDVRVAPLGPDAPSQVAVKPKVTASGSVTRVGARYVVKLAGTLVRPASVPAAAACKGTLKMTVKRGPLTIATKTISVRKTCAFGSSIAIKRAKVKRAKKLTVRLRFAGNTVLAPVTKVRTFTVKR